MKTYTKTYSVKAADKNKSTQKYMPFIISPLAGIAAVFALTLLFAAAQNKMYFGGLESTAVKIASYIISGAGALVCGFISGKKSSVRGFVAGIISAVVLIIIKFIIALFLKEGVFYTFDFIKLIEDFLICVAGSMTGVNKRK